MDRKAQAVFRAADGLLKSGVMPSERKVRAVLGGGSLRDICPALKAWRLTRATQAFAPPTVVIAPPVLDHDTVTRAEMEAAVALIKERADGERKHLMMETDRVRQEVAKFHVQKIEHLECENQILRAQVAALTRELAEK